MKCIRLSDVRLSTKLFYCYTLPLALAMVVYVLIFTTAQYYKNYRFQLEQQEISSRQSLMMIEDSLNQMDGVSQMVYYDASNLDALLQGPSVEGYFKAFTELRNHYTQYLLLTPNNENVLLLDCKGSSRLLCHNDSAWITPKNVQTEPWFQTVLEKQGKPYAFFMERVPFLNLEEPCVATARVIFGSQDRKPIAVSMVYQNISEMNEVFSKIQVDDNTIINIMDEEDQVIFSNHQQKMPPNAERTFYAFELVSVNNQDYLFTSVTSQLLGWRINAYLPFDTVPSLGQFLSIPNISVIVFLLILSALLSYVFSLSITKPLREMISALKVTETGDFSYNIKVSGSDEIALLSHAYNQMNNKIDQLIHEKYDLTIAETQARLKALQYQINPHFLFNTLTSIGATCENEVSTQMIQSLCQLLRYSLSNDFSCVPFSRELSSVEEYLYLQSCRFGDRCTYELDIDEETNSLSIPRLCLQPLVENAYQHGVEPQIEVCKIIITSKLVEDRFHIYVSNTGLPIAPETLARLNRCFQAGTQDQEQMGIGIVNVWNRLRWHFGKTCSMHISSNTRFTTVYLELPAIWNEPEK